MRKTWALLAALLAMAGAVMFLTTTPAGAAAIRVMPLGDSITGSPGCWRALLWNKLQSTGYTNIDFVGTLPAQGCSVPYDGDNEGHGGYLATNVANQNQLPGWLAATRPDIVMMHFGTNDVWSNIPTSTILSAYTTLVNQMRASNPAMKILVAKIIPMNPSTCAECAQRAVNLNNAIPGWATSTSTQQSPITVVDQWTGFSTSTDTYDGVHPNAAGDQKISDKWYPALVNALSGVTPSPSVTPTVTPTGGGGCTATYKNAGQWQGGFQGEVTVKNTGTTPMNGWTVRWTFANGQQISQIWNGTLSASGADVTVRNVNWNGSLAPGATATFGFLASWNGTNTAPTPTCA
ncbi:GDSL-like lipase/acylhydrolase family protein [Nonomuraea polychroma]|uniref:GDSL-like lipase/acylhydrolase family protein n=1 Tax=Nonomuraea polychroma TaxID=46176 RepID=A0A438MQK7_9ACTN|nr:cellulose binding domain-containing protein [Nonomuraea polychroma]RVX47691.1 GDSL-like lipase/acylhydrolase family protein [Nonomuraea polychroma]